MKKELDSQYDFPVSLLPMITAPRFGDEPNTMLPDITIDGKLAVVRTDSNKALGVVSTTYGLLKHADVIDSFRAALEGHDFKEKIVLTKNGAALFATYTIRDVQAEVQKGDLVGLQLTVKNSYDGSSTLQVSLGALRLVCTNGMVLSKKFFGFSMKHVGTMEMNQNILKEKITLMTEKFQEYLPQMQRMAQTAIVSPIDEIFDTQKLGLPSYLVDAALKEYERAADKTQWGYYNALTSAITHNMKRESPQAAINYGRIAWRVASN